MATADRRPSLDLLLCLPVGRLGTIHLEIFFDSLSLSFFLCVCFFPFFFFFESSKVGVSSQATLILSPELELYLKYFVTVMVEAN